MEMFAEEMEIEITASPTITDSVSVRPTTPGERAAALEHALDRSLGRMSKQALYALSKSPRLKNPFR